MEGRIEITGCDLRSFVQDAYRLSQPQGLGWLHYQPDDLTDEDLDQLVDPQFQWPGHAVSMDYVNGRAVKRTVRKEDDGRLTMPSWWYDHTDDAYRALCVKHETGNRWAELTAHVECCDTPDLLVNSLAGRHQVDVVTCGNCGSDTRLETKVL